MHRQSSKKTSQASARAGIVQRVMRATGAKTETELAVFLGVPRPTVASWKRRDSVPKATLLQVAMKTGATMEWLITGQGEPRDTSLLLPSIDADLLAIAIHRAEQWWREFDKGKRPATAAELSCVIATFYADTRTHYDNWRRHTGTDRADTLKAIRRIYAMSDRQVFAGPWGVQAFADDEGQRLLKSLIG